MQSPALPALTLTLALVPGGLRAAPAPASPLEAGESAAQTPSQPPLQRPAAAIGTAAPAPTDPEAGDPAPTAPDGGDPAAVPPAPASPAGPGLAEQLLGPSVNQHPSTRPTARVPTEAESAAEEDAAIAAMYRGLYRPRSNPGRFNVVARAFYGIAGSVDDTVSGRLGGLTADLGQSFNKFGYALTLVAQAGNLERVTSDRHTQTVALLGGGPTLSLGRLALLQRGFLDVRVGYDVLVGPTRRIVAGAPERDGLRVPHGPRLALNMGLMSNPARARKLFHGFGLTIGYQALLGSFRGDFPVTNVLQFGVAYWGG